MGPSSKRAGIEVDVAEGDVTGYEAVVHAARLAITGTAAGMSLSTGHAPLTGHAR